MMTDCTPAARHFLAFGIKDMTAQRELAKFLTVNTPGTVTFTNDSHEVYILRRNEDETLALDYPRKDYSGDPQRADVFNLGRYTNESFTQ